MKKFIALSALSGAVLLTACNNMSQQKTGEVVLPQTQAQPAAQTATAQNVVTQSAPVNVSQAINGHAVANQIRTVASLSDLRDETMVRLQGKITKAIDHERYEFTDATGTVVVEIDDEDWQGRTVTNTDVITIVGELDIDYMPTKRLKVDVDMVEYR